MPPAEEATNPDTDSTDEEAQAAETTQTGTSIATSANCKGIGKRNAERESRRTNLAEMPKDEHTGRESTSWRRTKTPSQSMQSIFQMMRYRTMKKSTDLT